MMNVSKGEDVLERTTGLEPATLTLAICLWHSPHLLFLPNLLINESIVNQSVRTDSPGLRPLGHVWGTTSTSPQCERSSIDTLEKHEAIPQIIGRDRSKGSSDVRDAVRSAREA